MSDFWFHVVWPIPATLWSATGFHLRVPTLYTLVSADDTQAHVFGLWPCSGGYLLICRKCLWHCPLPAVKRWEKLVHMAWQPMADFQDRLGIASIMTLMWVWNRTMWSWNGPFHCLLLLLWLSTFLGRSLWPICCHSSCCKPPEAIQSNNTILGFPLVFSPPFVTRLISPFLEGSPSSWCGSTISCVDFDLFLSWDLFLPPFVVSLH